VPRNLEPLHRKYRANQPPDKKTSRLVKEVDKNQGFQRSLPGKTKISKMTNPNRACAGRRGVEICQSYRKRKEKG
jgi:hypothetical protein